MISRILMKQALQWILQQNLELLQILNILKANSVWFTIVSGDWRLEISKIDRLKIQLFLIGFKIILFRKFEVSLKDIGLYLF